MSKSIQLKNKDNEKMYPNPYYPVGSIYLSVIDTNPSIWFDGTWELIAKGCTLVGVNTDDADFNEAKKIGGEKKHKLTESEMAKHRHYMSVYSPNWTDEQVVESNNAQWGSWGKKGVRYAYFADNKCFTGGDQPHNNMPPYFTCYIWCRVA